MLQSGTFSWQVSIEMNINCIILDTGKAVYMTKNAVVVDEALRQNFDDLEVLIVRHSGDWRMGAVRVADIKRVHWDNISGGVYRRQRGYSLYGYVPYDLAMETVACSGTHAHYGNNAKVKIVKEEKGSVYYEGYQYLLSLAGPKPHYNSNPLHLPPCTKAIIAFLEEHEEEHEGGFVTRRELRAWIKEKGYELPRYRRAIRQLIETGSIFLRRYKNPSNDEIYIL